MRYTKPKTSDLEEEEEEPKAYYEFFREDDCKSEQYQIFSSYYLYAFDSYGSDFVS